MRYLLGHGAKYNPDGSLSFLNASVEQVSRRVEEANQEVSQGSFKSDRENDTLTRALGTKEHCGRTRGTCLIPWKLTFEDDLGSYRSRERRKAAQDAMLNEVLQRVRDEVRQECDASNARLREEFEQRLSQREIDDGAQGSPMLNRSSCGSTGVPEQDALRRWPVDEIDAPKPCKLYVQEGFIKTKVAAGQAYPTPAGSILHCRPIPAGYAKVALDALVKKSYGKVELDFASNGESKKLKHNIGSFVAWRK